MPLPFHLLRLRPAATERPGESPRVIERKEDVQWGSPIFRAPDLSTPQQVTRELPFTANFRSAKIQRT